MKYSGGKEFDKANYFSTGIFNFMMCNDMFAPYFTGHSFLNPMFNQL